MSRSKLILQIAILAAFTFAVGIVHGHISKRWGFRADIAAGAKRLARVPERLGDWRLVSDTQLKADDVKMLQCAGHLNRVYKNERNGQEIRVVVLLGPPGPTSVHRPEICYAARNFQIISERQKWTLTLEDGTAHEFWDLRLKSTEELNGENLRSLYAWTNDRQWTASEDPRFEFGGRDYLYKIQLAGPEPASDNADACKDFLMEFVGAMRQEMLDPES